MSVTSSHIMDGSQLTSSGEVRRAQWDTNVVETSSGLAVRRIEEVVEQRPVVGRVVVLGQIVSHEFLQTKQVTRTFM